jgi:hypothetical protein
MNVELLVITGLGICLFASLVINLVYSERINQLEQYIERMQWGGE